MDELTVTTPVEGAQPTHPTTVRLAYDADFFYVGIQCYDDPAEVRARQRDRDAFVSFDDVVQMWFDPFNDERFAYWFQITAGGSRGDALLADSGASFNKNWDGIWYGRSKVTDDGWQAEIALPFKTLAFKRGETTWGFNFERTRVANGEDARWASPLVAYRFFNLAEGGQLLGMEGMEQGWGLDITPYGKLTGSQDRTDDPDADAEADIDVGLDVAWRPTSATNLRVTINTDFAETEVDERQVNLTRFPLFFPEKRDFFLEDAGVFEFGPPTGRGRPNLLAFFSRNIGRDDQGNAVPLLAGVKFTGRVGEWNIGVLDTYVDSFESEEEGDVPRKNLSVVRVSRNVGAESAVGVIATSGRPDAAGDAYTAGVDFSLGSSRLFGDGHSGRLWGYYLASSADGGSTDSDGSGDGSAYGLRARSTSSSWDHTLEGFRIDEGFDPKLGFLRRGGIDRYRYSGEYTWRGGTEATLRQVSTRVSPSYTQDLVGDEDTWIVPIRWFELELQSEDQVSFETRRIFERLDEGFDLSDDVFVSPGAYYMTRHRVSAETNDRRDYKVEAEIEWGDFFSGDIVRSTFAPLVIPGALFTWRLAYTDVRADLEEGDFTTQLVSTNFDFAFSPDRSWKNILQYDTESEQLGWQSRFRWIVKPGHDLFVVGLFGWDRYERDSFRAVTTDLTVKVAYTFRF